MDKTLKQWSESNGIKYEKAWRMFQNNEVADAYKNAKGRIFIKQTIPATPPPQVSLTNNSVKVINDMPAFKVENISMAADTRKNKAFDSEIANRFQNIGNGVIPVSSENYSEINVTDCIRLCYTAYHNFNVVKNIINLMTYFSHGRILWKNGNAKSRKFFANWADKIGLSSFLYMWFLDFYRVANDFTYVYWTKVTPEDINNINKVYGDSTSFAKKGDVYLPSKFILLNPLDIRVQGSASFVSPIYKKVLNSYEIAQLRKAAKLSEKEGKGNPDRELFDSLPSSIRKQIMDGKSGEISIVLDEDNLYPAFWHKTTYEPLAIPFTFGVLDDIDFKQGLRKCEIAAARMVNQSLLLVTTGFEGKDGNLHINENNIRDLQEIFKNESVGRVLIHDFSTKAQFVNAPLNEMLGSEKYKAVQEDIYTGLNYILLNEQKYANKQSALQTFIESLKYGRNTFLSDLLIPIVRKISKQLNFKTYPTPYFEDLNNLKDETEWNRLVVRMGEIGALTSQEMMEAFDGKLPLPDESIENQREFKKLKDEGLYQAVTQNVKPQLDVLKEKGKLDEKTQTRQFEHDDKQKSKDRKHAAENPQSPAPQIVLKAPTKLAQPNGRPPGSTRKKSTNKPRVLGSIDDNKTFYSSSELIKTMKSYDKLQKEIVAKLKEKHNLIELNKTQLNMASELSKVIARNENISNWNEDIINKYIENPLDNNTEMINEIETLAADMGLSPDLAALLFQSRIETTEDNQEEE